MLSRVKEDVYKRQEENGFGRVRAENPDLGFGAEVRWSLGSLPVLAQWKCMRSGEYVLGIEPSNSYIMGLSLIHIYNTHFGLLPTLSKGFPSA